MTTIFTPEPTQPQGRRRQDGPRATPVAPGGLATGARPATPGQTTFTPTNNLISTQINPTPSGQTNQATQYTNQAQGQYAGQSFTPFQGMGPLNFQSNVRPVAQTDSTWTAGQGANATRAGQNYANQTFDQFRTLAPMDFGNERGMLNSANTNVQGLNFDFSGANQQYGAAQSGLREAAGRAGGALAGLQGLGIGAFSGGGANTADFGESAGMARGAVNGLREFNYGGDTAAARGMTTPALQRAMNAPDRNALASESLSLLEERSRPGFDQTLRSVGERNAAMGRRGSGITTNELGDVTMGREREMALARRELANDASSRTMQDNADRVNLALGTAQGLGAEDRGAAGINQGNASLRLQGAGLLSDQSRFNASQGEAASQRAASGAQFGAGLQRGLANDIYGMGRDQAGMAMEVGDRSGQQTRDRVGLGLDQANFQRGTANDLGGMTRDTWTSAQSERNRARDDEFDRANFGRGQFNDFTGAFERGQNNDRNNRNELRDEMRDERDFGYGQARDRFDREVRERDTRRGDEFDQANFGRNRFNDFAGFQRDREGEDRNSRNEVRGERDFQYNLSRDAIDDGYRQQGWEEQLRNNRFNRARQTADFGFGGADPGGALDRRGRDMQGQAGDMYDGMAQLLAQLGQGGGRRRGAGGGG